MEEGSKYCGANRQTYGQNHNEQHFMCFLFKQKGSKHNNNKKIVFSEMET